MFLNTFWDVSNCTDVSVREREIYFNIVSSNNEMKGFEQLPSVVSGLKVS